MKNLNYFIWLQMALGPGANNTGLIFETYKSPEDIYHATSMERKLSGVFRPAQINKMEETKLSDADEIIKICTKEEIDIVTFLDERFPKNLLNLSDFPIVLYVKGDLSVLEGKIPFAVVGTRKPVPKSIVAARELSKALSRCGFIIVSGGALGIDSAAHTGALKVFEKTICVLGTGILSGYLKENAPLREVISKNGAVISEFFPNMDGAPWTFPMRNRLISGISEGIAVIEGQVTSGSLNTAKHANNQGRDVFAMPSSGLGTYSKGCDDLLRDGAIELCLPLDVVSQYLRVSPELIKVDESVDLSINLNEFDVEDENDLVYNKVKRDITDDLSKEAICVYSTFEENSLSIKQISKRVVMPMKSMFGALTELEIYGYIELLSKTKH